jgi:DNA-binding GntR family transcriptional regulator
MFNTVKTYLKILVDMGIEIKDRLVYVGKSEDIEINEKFEDAPIYEMHRIFYLDGEPSFFIKHYCPINDLTTLPQKSDDEFSLYVLLVKQGFKVCDIEDTITAQKTPEGLYDTLPDLSDICLKRTRSSFDDRRRLVEYSVVYCDAVKTPYLLHYQV